MDDLDILEQELRKDVATAAAFERARPREETAMFVLGARLQLGLTQTAFARYVGMTQPEIARLESGQHSCSWETLSRILDAVGAGLTMTVCDEGGASQTVNIKEFRPDIAGRPRDADGRRTTTRVAHPMTTIRTRSLKTPVKARTD
jgi:transcriptional regulator with XRE-family HTH domain